MSFKCIMIQNFSCPKDSSLISMYSVCAQGAAVLQEGLESLLRCISALLSSGSLCGWKPQVQNVYGVPKTRFLWIYCVQSHSQGTTAWSSSETLQDLKASGGK